MISFEKPQYGWIKINIFDKEEKVCSFSASYLTDVPNDLLKASILMLESKTPFLIELDSEGEGIFTILNLPYDYSFKIINYDKRR